MGGTTSDIRGRVRAAACVALLVAALGGCSGMPDLSTTSLMVTPGKYDLYSCQDIENHIRYRRSRVTELDNLTTQAAAGTGGAVVGAITYRSERALNQGELDELVRTLNNKQCVTQSPWSSQRAVF